MTHSPWLTHRTAREHSPRIGFNLELSFQLAAEPHVTQRRRLVLITEAFKAIADRDDRLVSWFILPLQPDGWVQIRTVIGADQPGEAAALSETWMDSAIAAANLADDPAAARLPSPRTRTSVSTEPTLPLLR